ncbi:pyrroloquinoline quinone biosynthesis protein PqqB [Mesobacillus boroniphilus]|uniref:Pyrroloquinoline quinone biosynthesis protein PqqB n=1 Tax=Mesobacillus boroniphilus TaxID=308892 RepID=A0A944CME3_9BACI|nr:MBL fold metallo-hydrolase [Mesobacillus boroniphilus]MBS8265669.1 pyrroloquinoline quinone biosynthesis protein PqqB [Mesobacillus boroniphilus]
MDKSIITVKILGTAQDGGIPQANCFCNNCTEAINNPSKKRFASSLGILLPDLKKWYMLDATPDFKDQLLLINKDHQAFKLDGIILSHAHIGHYTGLMFLGKEAMATNELDIFAGNKMKNMLTKHFPWKQLVDLNNINIKDLIADHPIKLESNLTITPLEVPHRNEYSETFGFVISGLNKKILYIPDIDKWEEWDCNLVDIASKVDYCFIDATFYSEEELKQLGRNFKDIPHPYITDSMDLLQKVVDRNKCEVYFLHFNHTNPILNSGSAERTALKNRGFKIAEEGMEFHL